MAANVAVTYNFTAGTPAVADNVDQNFTDVVNWINTNAVHLDGSKAFSAIPSGPASDPTSANQLTRKAYVDKKLTVCTSGTRPGSPTEGDYIYETDTNRRWVYDGAAWQLDGGSTPRVLCTNSTTVSCAASTLRTVPWNQETYDTDSLHSTSVNTSRITIPAGMGGIWHFSGSIQWANGVGSGERQSFLQVNGGGARYGFNLDVMGSSTETVSQTISSDIFLSAGDYVEVWLFQTSAGSINSNPSNIDYLMATWRGPA